MKISIDPRKRLVGFIGMCFLAEFFILGICKYQPISEIDFSDFIGMWFCFRKALITKIPGIRESCTYQKLAFCLYGYRNIENTIFIEFKSN